ncbi:hypothetical protein CXP35_13360 [Komagataeibacter xylinus]|nr:hypothetical protein CXP35_13360 [Komagataeibacter xylinus]
MKSQLGKHPEITRKFLAKLFSKSFEEHCLFEKRRYPRTFILYFPAVCSPAAGGLRRSMRP